MATKRITNNKLHAHLHSNKVNLVSAALASLTAVKRATSSTNTQAPHPPPLAHRLTVYSFPWCLLHIQIFDVAALLYIFFSYLFIYLLRVN